MDQAFKATCTTDNLKYCCIENEIPTGEFSPLGSRVIWHKVWVYFERYCVLLMFSNLGNMCVGCSCAQLERYHHKKKKKKKEEKKTPVLMISTSLIFLCSTSIHDGSSLNDLDHRHNGLHMWKMLCLEKEKKNCEIVSIPLLRNIYMQLNIHVVPRLTRSFKNVKSHQTFKGVMHHLNIFQWHWLNITYICSYYTS